MATKRGASLENARGAKTKAAAPTDSVSGIFDPGNGLTAAQNGILLMQQTRGNAAVRRALQQRASTVQRDPPPGGGSVLDQFTPSILRPNWAAIQQTIQQGEQQVIQWMDQNAADLRPRVGQGMDAMVGYVRQTAPNGTSIAPDRMRQMLTDWAQRNNTIIPTIPLFNNPAPPPGGQTDRTPIQGALSYTLVRTRHVGVGGADSSTDTQHQFSATLTWQMHQENQPGVEVSAVVQVAYNQDFSQVTSVQGGGQAAWVQPTLNGLLQLSGFVQLLAGSANTPAQNNITGQQQMTITPTAQAALGGQAMFQLFSGHVQVGAQVTAGPTVTGQPGGGSQTTMDFGAAGVLQVTF